MIIFLAILFFILLLVLFYQTYKRMYIIRDIQQVEPNGIYVNQPLIYVTKPISNIKYPENDIVNNISYDKTHKNIKFDTNEYKRCNTSNDCSYGMVCASSNGDEYKCSKRIPVSKCNLSSCQQNESELGGVCGGETTNMVLDGCVSNLECVSSNNIINTAVGTCSIIR